jgi:hypothetical protein
LSTARYRYFQAPLIVSGALTPFFNDRPDGG